MPSGRPVRSGVQGLTQVSSRSTRLSGARSRQKKPASNSPTKEKRGRRDGFGLAGTSVRVGGIGGVVSSTCVAVATGPVPPAASVARTLSVYAPSGRADRSSTAGLAQGAQSCRAVAPRLSRQLAVSSGPRTRTNDGARSRLGLSGAVMPGATGARGVQQVAGAAGLAGAARGVGGPDVEGPGAVRAGAQVGRVGERARGPVRDGPGRTRSGGRSARRPPRPRPTRSARCRDRGSWARTPAGARARRCPGPSRRCGRSRWCCRRRR